MASVQTNILEFNANLCIQDLVDTYNECDLPFFNQNEVQELDEHKFFITLNQLAQEYVLKDYQPFSMHLIDYYCSKYSKKQIIAKSCYSFYYCWKKILKSSSDARLYAFCCFNKLIPSKLIKFYCKIRKQIHSLVTDKQQVLIPTINSIEINLEQVLSLIKKMFQKSDAIQQVNQNLTNFLQKNKVVYTPKEKIKACLVAEFIIEQYIQITLGYEYNNLSQEGKFQNGNKNQFQQENNYESSDQHQQQKDLQQQNMKYFIQNDNQEPNNNLQDQVFQNNMMKNSHSSSNLKSQGNGYMRIHNLKQSKSQSQILPIRNRFLGSSSKSPLRKSSSSQNRMSQNNRNQTPNIIITHEEQQNDLLQSDQNLQKTIKRKSEQNQSQDNTLFSTMDENSKKPQILLEIQNNSMKSEIENFKNQVAKLQDENQFCQIFNQKLEQIFLEILEISIESDYRSNDVDKIIEKYEELKKQQGDQCSLLEFRENISQMKELAQLKSNTLQQNSLFSSQEHFNGNNIRKISHNNSSQVENPHPFSISSGNENQNNALSSPAAMKSSQKKRSAILEEVNNQNNSNNCYFTEDEQQQRQHLALLEEVSQSLSQQINKNNLQTLEKIIKQDQHQQQVDQSPQLLSVSFTNLNSQQLPQSSSPLMQSSFYQIKDMLQSNKNKRNSLSPAIFQQSISFREEGEHQLSKKNSENHREFLNSMNSFNFQLNNDSENQNCKQQEMQNLNIQKQPSQQSMSSLQQLQKNQANDLSMINPQNNLMNEKSKQMQQDQKQELKQSYHLQLQATNSKQQSLQSPLINITNSSSNNNNNLDKQQPQQEMSQNQQHQFQQQQKQTFQFQQQSNIQESSNNKSILDQLNQIQQQKLLEIQQIQQLIQSQKPKDMQKSQIPQIFGQNNDQTLQQQQKKQEMGLQNQVNQTFQYQQKQPFKLNQTIESDIKTFDPSMSIPSSIASNHQQNQQALHRQHYQNLLQRQQEKQEQENNQQLKNQSQFSRINSDKYNEYDHHSNAADDSWSIKTFDPDNIPQVNSAFNKNNQLCFGSQGGSHHHSQNRKSLSLIQYNNQKIHSNYKINKMSENMHFLNGIKEQIEEGYDKKSNSIRDTPKSSSCGENIQLSESEGYKTYTETQISALKNIKNKII
ncbi:hypothetical protein TTHERM_00822350 (macronuclear) [Tetrahymena thermophila SB210]|uniref:Uncharacterized protein n=1 Tax=Tetrahymena thermophila (strain SB210) TaxID=312017 RepID=Q22EY0_TETTS|nr:hypothetical protein TTHERM_00822350 [Tetrahymena thermophila SB210]EAR83895.2 hypothetical protein TTHERM_00822350 [Tetrahymena thermophila SB210]|eukprot:XP_001031558.2 hypothetical protein TTHERM_00822350 [Tetrahymena thermophila SB210]